ncbi:MAG: peptide-methionine (S)-S-oxide reductase MsrA [Bacteriovoracia bacterium]
MESPFDKLPGVKSVVVGYTGGKTKDPTYKEVSGGSTGHAEAVQITFDPQRISYLELLDVYWRNVDPTAVDRQFVDVGTQYRTAIFYHTEKQKREALDSKARLENLGKFKGKVVTEITAASVFYPAESYHQGYYKKNPLEYERYRKGSGRDAFLDGVWGSEQRKAHP